MNFNDIKVVNPSAAPLSSISPTKIKVVGCGGCGGNAVNTMIETNVGGVEFIALNTDLQALANSKAEHKIQIGQKLAGGLGAGGKPEVGEESAKEQQEQIKELLKGSDMVFITAGMGGGTGTGSAPVVAKIARDLGALTVAVVTTPFDFEGRIRMAHAKEGVKKLRAEVDSLIAIPNELILKDAEKRLSVEGAFVIINDILRQGVQGISDIITKPGLVNRDFRDVESVMKGQGDAILGIGVGQGDNRATDAAHAAINNRLLVDTNIDGAKNVLINICGNHDVGISECNEIASIITERANPDAVVLWGQVLDEAMEDRISVTVIATGFDSAKKTSAEIPAAVVSMPAKDPDTMPADVFEKVGVSHKNPAQTIAASASPAPRKEPAAETNPIIRKIGLGTIYEEDPKFDLSSARASENPQPANPFGGTLERFGTTAPAQDPASAASAASTYGYDPSNLSIPAAWRDLGNLSSSLTF